VQGDFRTYRHPGLLKIKWTDIAELEKMSTKLINHYSNINRCVKEIGKNYTGKITDIQVKKCYIDKKRVQTLQNADYIVMKYLEEMKLYNKVWQFPVVLVPIAFNGVGEESIILRPIDSIDMV